jgi:hypothetical protein
MKKIDFSRDPETLLLLLPFRRTDPFLAGILTAHVATAIRKATAFTKNVDVEKDQIFANSIAVFTRDTLPFSFQSN